MEKINGSLRDPLSLPDRIVFLVSDDSDDDFSTEDNFLRQHFDGDQPEHVADFIDSSEKALSVIKEKEGANSADYQKAQKTLNDFVAKLPDIGKKLRSENEMMVVSGVFDMMGASSKAIAALQGFAGISSGPYGAIFGAICSLGSVLFGELGKAGQPSQMDMIVKGIKTAIDEGRFDTVKSLAEGYLEEMITTKNTLQGYIKRFQSDGHDQALDEDVKNTINNVSIDNVGVNFMGVLKEEIRGQARKQDQTSGSMGASLLGKYICIINYVIRLYRLRAFFLHFETFNDTISLAYYCQVAILRQDILTKLYLLHYREGGSEAKALGTIDLYIAHRDDLLDYLGDYAAGPTDENNFVYQNFYVGSFDTTLLPFIIDCYNSYSDVFADGSPKKTWLEPTPVRLKKSGGDRWLSCDSRYQSRGGQKPDKKDNDFLEVWGIQNSSRDSTLWLLFYEKGDGKYKLYSVGGPGFVYVEKNFKKYPGGDRPGYRVLVKSTGTWDSKHAKIEWKILLEGNSKIRLINNDEYIVERDNYKDPAFNPFKVTKIRGRTTISATSKKDNPYKSKGRPDEGLFLDWEIFDKDGKKPLLLPGRFPLPIVC